MSNKFNIHTNIRFIVTWVKYENEFLLRLVVGLGKCFTTRK